MSAQCSVVNKYCWKLCTCTHFVLIMIIITVFRCSTDSKQNLWSRGRIDYWCNNKNYDDNHAFHNKYESNQLSLWVVNFLVTRCYTFNSTKPYFFLSLVNQILRACGRKTANARVVFDITNRHIRAIASYYW